GILNELEIRKHWVTLKLKSQVILIFTSTTKGKHGIKWTAYMQFDDIDIADHLDIPSYTHKQIQIRTNSVTQAFESVSLNIHKPKTTILKYNKENINQINQT
ncbi:hypothetical protein MS3_00000929, partial [Schistosoma haematobium]